MDIYARRYWNCRTPEKKKAQRHRRLILPRVIQKSNMVCNIVV